MKLTVIGATGPTGQILVKQALEQGHEVRAVVRTPSKMKTTHENLQVIEADLSDATNLVEHFRGCDAVLSAIGSVAAIRKPCDVYTTTGKAAIAAMREAGVNRFICLTSWGTKDWSDLPFMTRKIFFPLFRNVMNNMAELEDYLATECDDINYTVVKPPRLTNAGPKDTKVNITEGKEVVEKYRSNTMSRYDVAIFMLSCLTSDLHGRKKVAVNTD